MPRTPYHGLDSKLLLAIDVGTTFSGVSFCILEPGVVPEIQGVTRYPAQGQIGGNAKIPSILWYDEYGAVRAVGAEAEQPSVIEMAEDYDWQKAEWFKLHLCPPDMLPTELKGSPLKPLPVGKTVDDVYADILRYLFNCAKEYIIEGRPDGSNLLESLLGHAEIILSHPNGWDGRPQARMRGAAIKAGLVPDTEEGQSRVIFVTEGEASLHFCIAQASTTDGIMNGQGVIIVDAGGGTVDLSAYQLKEAPLSFQEIAPQISRVQGSVRVTERAGPFLEAKLKGSKYGQADDIKEMVRNFDQKAKVVFRNQDEPSYIKFGSNRDKDIRVGIKGGQLMLPGHEVASLFEPSIQAIIEAIEEQRAAAHAPISDVLLVGGFAASDWLFSRLKEYLQSHGLKLGRPDSHVNKAVADGAISFYIDHFVSVRVAKTTYGVSCGIPYDPSDPEHKRRSNNVYRQLDGRLFVSNSFSTILAKGTRVSETREFSEPFFQEWRRESSSHVMSIDILKYDGKSSHPSWLDIDSVMYRPMCTVVADVSQAVALLPRGKTAKGVEYSYHTFNVVLILGLTEIKAQVSWIEDGEEKRCPAAVVYEEERVNIR